MRTAAVLLPLLLVAAAGLAVTLDHAGRAVYHLPAYAVVAAIAAFLAAAAGVALAWRSRHLGRTLAAALVVALALTGVAAILSVGVLMLAAAAVVAAVLAMRPARGGGSARALVAGALVGLALPVLALTALSPPLVDCETGRAGENVFLGAQSDSTSGSGSMSVGGDARGRVAGDGYEYKYACEGDRLVEFEFRSR